MVKPNYRPRFMRSAIARQALRRAAELLRHPAQVIDLMEQAARRGKQGLPPPLRELWDDVCALFRLVRAYSLRDYRDVRPRSIVFAIAAILYFLWPIDAVPDAVPIVGWLDDAAVFSFVLNTLRQEIGRFLDWESRGLHCIEVSDITPRGPLSRKKRP